MIGASTFDTSLGRCAMAWSPCGISALVLPDETGTGRSSSLVEGIERIVGAVDWAAPPTHVMSTIVRLQSHLDGKLDPLADVVLDTRRVTPFMSRVYQELQRVCPGQTVSYAELAARIHQPHAARAVGQALARNRIPLLIPCHRVIARNGCLGAFSAGGGSATKRRLLMLEGAEVALQAVNGARHEDSGFSWGTA